MKDLTIYILIATFFLGLFSIPASIYGLTREVCKLRMATERPLKLEIQPGNVHALPKWNVIYSNWDVRR